MRLAPLAAFLLASSLAAHAGEPCAQAPLVRVPFTLGEGGHVLVPGAVAGRRTWLAVDTGGLWSLLAETLVRELRLKSFRGKHEAVDAAGVAFDRHVTVPEIQLGPKRLGGPSDFLIMQSLDQDGIAGGTLGLNVLSRFDLEIDGARRTIALHAQGRCKPAWPSLKIQGRADGGAGMPIIAGTLDGAPARVLVDTGSTATYVDRAFAHRHFGLTRSSPGMARAGHLTTPTGGTIEATSYIFKDLALESLHFQNLPVLIADLHGADVTLGQAQLQKVRLHFAFADEKIYVAETTR